MQSTLCHDVARRNGAPNSSSYDGASPTLAPEYLTPRQVSQLTGFSPRALEAMRSKRTGPAFSKLGTGKNGAVRYRVVDVRAWIERHRADAA